MKTPRTIGKYTVLIDSNELALNDRVTKLSPKEMGVLELLLENVNSTVTRVELLKSVWGDKFANDQGLTQVISRLRNVLSEDSRVGIKTIPKKGYQLQQSDQRSIPTNGKTKKLLTTLAVVILVCTICFLVFIRSISVKIDIQNEKNQPIESSEIYQK